LFINYLNFFYGRERCYFILSGRIGKGYAIDQKRLKDQSRQLDELKQTVKLLGNVIATKTLNSDEATGLLKVVTDYAYALDILDQYDHQVLEIQSTTPEEIFQITYPEAMNAIQGLKDKFGGSTFLFVWFLEKNRILYRPDGSKKIADNALVALTLMIAESKPDEKDMMIKVVVNLSNLKN
jgi:hypothetical protein